MKRSATIAMLLLVVVQAFAFKWPVRTVDLTATFGEYRGNHFHSGIDIGGGEQDVFPISEGELVFAHTNEGYSSVPVGLGNFVVLEHEAGIRSVYAHLKDDSVVQGARTVSAVQRIGIIGDTGSSYGLHLHLTIIDTEEGTYLNPLAVLPPRAGGQAPIVRRIFFRTPGGPLEELRGDREVRGRRTMSPSQVEILAEIYDLRENVEFIWKLAPYSIIVYGNGSEMRRITFDSFGERDGLLTLGRTANTFSDTYDSRWLYRLGIVDLAVGEMHLQIAAADYSGNGSAQEVFLTVRE